MNKPNKYILFINNVLIGKNYKFKDLCSVARGIEDIKEFSFLGDRICFITH